MEGVLDQRVKSLYPEGLFIRAGRVLRRVFGCWHRDMSFPFSCDNETYRTCVACGARRRFDVEQWAMIGPYYYRSTVGAAHDNGC